MVRGLVRPVAVIAQADSEPLRVRRWEVVCCCPARAGPAHHLAQSHHLGAREGARHLVGLLNSDPDAEWTLVTTVVETSGTLAGLTPGVSMQLRIVAANDGGVAVPGAAVATQVPMALAA